MLSKDNFYIDINNLIFNYKNISIADFSLFILNNKIDSKNTILLLFFLILKNNSNFWNLSVDKLEFTIRKEDYILQLQLLKNFNNLQSDFSNNLEGSLITSGLCFKDNSIEQVFFDLSILSNLNNVLFLNNKIHIHNIIVALNPFDKYNLIKKSITKKQQKQLFVSSLSNFRTSSIFIINDLFLQNPSLFSKNIMIKYLNIFSQCNSTIHNLVFKFLLTSSLKSAFKLGTKLSYTRFSDTILIEFFDRLYINNSEVFFLISSGFISNSQQIKSFAIDYLIKKINFIKLNDRLKIKKTHEPKVIKI